MERKLFTLLVRFVSACHTVEFENSSITLHPKKVYAEQIETDEDVKEQLKKKLEAEKQQFEAEKQQFEADYSQLEAEKQAEKQQFEADYSLRSSGCMRWHTTY